MAVLTNIVVVDADLTKVIPDLSDRYLFSGQMDFSAQIIQAKKIAYREIKDHFKHEHPGYTDTGLDTALVDVKDFGNEDFIKDRIVYYTLSLIFLANRELEMSENFTKQGKQFPLQYYVDADSSGTAAASEIYQAPNIRFSR